MDQLNATVSTYRWILPAPVPESVSLRFPRACRPLLQVLYNRNIVADEPDPARLQEFMDLKAPDTDPFLLRDMDRAVERIREEIRQGRPIGVFGHYDCDGVTAAVVLTEALSELGTTAIPYIPSRSDAYGIPVNGIVYLASLGVRLIVTVDCGIKAFAEVSEAAAMGIDIVITDHHQCDHRVLEDGTIVDVLPEAIAVVNPKRSDCPYPFKSLAGVGIAFRLAQALAAATDSANVAELEKLLDLVCLGTVADVVDLVGENRRLVARGLDVLRAMKRPGLQSLTGAAEISPGNLSSRDVAFVLAPRLNAAARLKHGRLSLDLLRSTSCTEAEPLALELEGLNRQRREMTDRAVERACEVLADKVRTHTILVANGDWAPGISGLVASQLKERFGKPALAICDPANSVAPRIEIFEPECAGSARSIPGFDITAALGTVRHRLVRYGGHSGAAGFTIVRDEIPRVEEDLNCYASQTLAPDLIGPRLFFDAILSETELDSRFGVQLARFEPFGQGNPAPLFLLPAVSALPGSVRIYPSGKIYFRIQGPGKPIRVTTYALGLLGALESEAPVDLACQVQTSSGGSREIKLSVLDGCLSRPAPLDLVCVESEERQSVGAAG